MAAECTIVVATRDPSPKLCNRLAQYRGVGREYPIIVVDDGSTASCLGTFQSLKEMGVRVIHHGVNQGLPAARNTGFSSVMTTYALPLDDDDSFEPLLIERGIALLEQDKTAAFAYSWARLVGAVKGIMRFPEWDIPYLLARNLCCCTAVIRRSAWEEVGGYSEDMNDGLEDWELWIKFAEAGYHGLLIPQPLFTWYRRKESMTERMWRAGKAGVQRKRLVEKHRTLYEKYLPDVIALMAEDAYVAEGGRFFQTAKLIYYRILLPMLRKCGLDK